ncbi:hypothetical protein AeNC1_013351 [Aphanomyces euteiches]|nr:hypothetical protein AeNC1_013351 [Aphanomyces euteiches]
MKYAGAAIALVSLTTAFALWRLAATGELSRIIEWIREHQLAGSFVYVLVFSTCIIACLPATVFELAAGYIFGFGWGWLLATIGKTTGSLISFALGRYYLQEHVLKTMNRGPPLFRALAQLMSKNELKWKLVILTRIAWMPIAIKNYGLSVLPVSFALFFWPMLLVGAIFTAISVSLGHSATHVTSLLAGDDGSNSPLKIVVMVVGAASAFGLVGIVGYHTRRHLEEMAKDSDPETELMTDSPSSLTSSSDEESLEDVATTTELT